MRCRTAARSHSPNHQRCTRRSISCGKNLVYRGLVTISYRDIFPSIQIDAQFLYQSFVNGVNKSHRQQNEIGFDDLLFAGMYHVHSSCFGILLPIDPFDFDSGQHPVFTDKTGSSEIPTPFATLFVRRRGFQHFRQTSDSQRFICCCKNESLFPPYGRAFPVLRKRLFRMSGRAFRRAVMCSSVRRKRLFRIFPGKLRGCRCYYMRLSFMFFRLPVSVSRICVVVFFYLRSVYLCISAGMLL